MHVVARDHVGTPQGVGSSDGGGMGGLLDSTSGGEHVVGMRSSGAFVSLFELAPRSLDHRRPPSARCMAMSPMDSGARAQAVQQGSARASTPGSHEYWPATASTLGVLAAVGHASAADSVIRAGKDKVARLLERAATDDKVQRIITRQQIDGEYCDTYALPDTPTKRHTRADT